MVCGEYNKKNLDKGSSFFPIANNQQNHSFFLFFLFSPSFFSLCIFFPIYIDIHTYFNMSTTNTNEERPYTCFVCCRPASTKCSQCKVLAYCSRHCQRMHWRHHKHSCSAEGLKVAGHVFSTYEEFAQYPFGCCLDCYNEGRCTPITFFCDYCNRPRICKSCETIFQKCQFCRT